MANARVTHVGTDVLRQGDGKARVTYHAVEVLRNNESKARVTHHAVDVLLPDIPSLEHIVTGVSVQVAHDQVGDPDMTFTQSGVEAIAGGDQARSEITQQGVEAVVGGDRESEITQEGVEVIWFPDAFPGCESGSVFYRVRVRLPGAVSDLAQYTSLPTGDDSVIIREPRIDASTIDVLRGETTIGGCTVQLADPDEGTCLSPDLTTRRFTKILADAQGESQLLGARLFIEATDNPAPTEPDWLPYWGGYVASVRFVDAITVEISGAHSTRDDSTTMIWKEANGEFRTQGHIMGGPTLVDWPSSKIGQRITDNEGDWVAIVTNVTPTYVEFDINEDLSSNANSGIGRAFPPLDVRPYIKDNAWVRFSNNDAQRNVFSWAQRNAQPYFVEGGPDDATLAAWKATGTVGWFPRLRCLFVRKNNTPLNLQFPVMAAPRTAITAFGQLKQFNEIDGNAFIVEEFRSKLYEDLGNKFRVYWPSTSPNPQPSPGDQMAFYVRALDVSEANPLLINDHPVNILTRIWDEQGVDYDAASAEAVRTALGDFIVALRIKEPMSLKDVQTMLCGGFGFGWRYAPNGLRYLFTTRVRPEVSGTITLSDLVSDDGVVWENEESTRVFSASYEWKRLTKWPGQENGGQAERALDGIMEYEVGPIVFQTDDLGSKPFGARDETYKVPGSVYVLEDGEVAPNWTAADHVEITANLTAPILEQFGRGGIKTTLHLNHCVLVQEGEDWILDLPHRPGFDALESPVAQRALPERVQCVSRTPHPWGSVCEFIRVPQTEGTVVPATPGVATAEPITLAVEVHDATATGGNVITEADIDDSFTAYPYYTSFILAADNNDYYDLLDADVFVDYYEGPAAPADGLQTRYANTWNGLNAIEIGGFSPAALVWYRTQVRLGNGYVFPFSAWASVQLSNTTQAATPTVSLTPDGSWNIDAEIVAAPTTVRLYVAADTTTYPTEAATLLETPIAGDSASLAAIIPTLAEGETAYVTAIAEDIFGNRSIVSTSFFTRPGGGTGGGGTALDRRVRLVNSGTTSLSTVGAWTPISFDTETYDTGDLHSVSVNTSRITAQVAGNYFLTGALANSIATSGFVLLGIRLNGAGDFLAEQFVAPGGNGLGITTSAQRYLNAGDYVELMYYVSNTTSVPAGRASFSASLVDAYGFTGASALNPIYTKYDPFCPPSAPSSLDDEFIVDASGTGAPAGWTSVGTLTPAFTIRNGSLFLRPTTATTSQQGALIEKVLPSGPFTVVCHVVNLAATNWNPCGLYLRSSVSGRRITWNQYQNTGGMGDRWLNAENFTALDSRNAVTADLRILDLQCFLRLSYDGTTLYYEVSANGKDWIIIRTEAMTSWFTGGNLPDRVGLQTKPENATFVGGASFEFFRYFPTAFADIGRNVGVGSDGAILEPNALYLHNKVI